MRMLTRVPLIAALATVATASDMDAQSLVQRLELSARIGSYRVPDGLYWAATEGPRLIVASLEDATAVEIELGFRALNRVVLVSSVTHTLGSSLYLEGSSNCAPSHACPVGPFPPDAFENAPATVTIGVVGLRVEPLGDLWRVRPYVGVGAGYKWYRFGDIHADGASLVPSDGRSRIIQRAVGAELDLAKVGLVLQVSDYKGTFRPNVPAAMEVSRPHRQEHMLWSFGLRISG
jgi:hypothetical protein